MIYPDQTNTWATINIKLLKKIIFIIFFVMLISTPFAYKDAKILLLVLLLFSALANFKNYISVPIKKELLLVFTFFIATNCFFILTGVFNDNIGVWPTYPVNFIWPILYFIIFLDARFYIDYEDILFLFKVSISIICMYVLIFYLSIFFGFTFPINENLIRLSFDPKDPIATENQIVMPAANSLFYLVPFFMSYVLLSKEKIKSNYIFLFIGFLISIATGRRALILLTMASPFMILAIFFILPHRKKSIKKSILKKIFIVFIVLSIASVILEKSKIIDVSFLINKTVTYFVPKEGVLQAGALTRDIQSKALLDQWEQKPLLGFGFGATCVNYKSSYEIPWAYELSYVSKLMNSGIIGLSIYFFYLFYLIFSQVPFLRVNYFFYLANMAGFLSIIIANASNPYLDSFEYMWMIYFQVLFIWIGQKHRVDNSFNRFSTF